MSGITVRKAGAQDAAALAALLRQVGSVHAEGRPDIYCSPLTKHGEQSALAIIQSKDGGVLIAEYDGKVVGELIFKRMSRECDGFYRARKWIYIDDLCVDENFRGGGTAKALSDEAERIARHEGCDAIELNCWAFNTRASGFYERMGYQPQKTEYEKILK